MVEKVTSDVPKTTEKINSIINALVIEFFTCINMINNLLEKSNTLISLNTKSDRLQHQSWQLKAQMETFKVTLKVNCFIVSTTNKLLFFCFLLYVKKNMSIVILTLLFMYKLMYLELHCNNLPPNEQVNKWSGSRGWNAISVSDDASPLLIVVNKLLVLMSQTPTSPSSEPQLVNPKVSFDLVNCSRELQFQSRNKCMLKESYLYLLNNQTSISYGNIYQNHHQWLLMNSYIQQDPCKSISIFPSNDLIKMNIRIFILTNDTIYFNCSIVSTNSNKFIIWLPSNFIHLSTDKFCKYARATHSKLMYLARVFESL
ncbi:hypothetical protein AGLY_000397 [Aphis glycines]|uniref:Uncharacterized protein n=1 Tax=Aphis glycines TaxID=307491 RepID=A0A6G0U6V0_APHGL|nr:hypothetical protein AGLY_000397 [Aphis glycines]